MLIDGRALAQNILDKLKGRVERLKKQEIIPHLTVIRVGDDPAITSYINQKRKFAAMIGAELEILQYEVSIDEQTLLETVRKIFGLKDIHGVIVQLPLPPRF